MNGQVSTDCENKECITHMYRTVNIIMMKEEKKLNKCKKVTCTDVDEVRLVQMSAAKGIKASATTRSKKC